MILLGAVALDLVFGEPRNVWHPVAWTGRWLSWVFTRAPREGRAAPLAAGTAVVVATAAAAAGIARLAGAALRSAGVAGAVGEAWLLKCALSVRGLVEAARVVERRLQAGDLPGARREVGVHLVSRDTTDLQVSGVVSATVESVAENLTDSIVAPIFWYLCLGLPGTWAYRIINTADAMVGYRTGGFAYLGKAAARLDDALNFVPARIAGLALVLAAFAVRADSRAAWRMLRGHRRRPASPNSGWTMAAMAGALGVTLEKAGAYRLGAGPPPAVEAIERSLDIMTVAAAGCIAAGLVIALSSSSRPRRRRII
jgi:adenosylcobinamide-phosphate synthase